VKLWTLSIILSLSGLLGGCNTVREIPDKTPCTRFIRASTIEPPPCLATPVNTPVTVLLET
jgi:hypothetical protein